MQIWCWNLRHIYIINNEWSYRWWNIVRFIAQFVFEFCPSSVWQVTYPELQGLFQWICYKTHLCFALKVHLFYVFSKIIHPYRDAISCTWSAKISDHCISLSAFSVEVCFLSNWVSIFMVSSKIPTTRTNEQSLPTCMFDAAKARASSNLQSPNHEAAALEFPICSKEGSCNLEIGWGHFPEMANFIWQCPHKLKIQGFFLNDRPQN